MVFIEFVSGNHPRPGAKYYFVGSTEADILDDTENGTVCGSARFQSHRLVSRTFVESLEFTFLNRAIAAVEQGCRSYRIAVVS